MQHTVDVSSLPPPLEPWILDAAGFVCSISDSYVDRAGATIPLTSRVCSYLHATPAVSQATGEFGLICTVVDTNTDTLTQVWVNRLEYFHGSLSSRDVLFKAGVKVGTGGWREVARYLEAVDAEG